VIVAVVQQVVGKCVHVVVLNPVLQTSRVNNLTASNINDAVFVECGELPYKALIRNAYQIAGTHQFDLFCTSTALLHPIYFDLCTSTFCQIWISYRSKV